MGYKFSSKLFSLLSMLVESAREASTRVSLKDLFLQSPISNWGTSRDRLPHPSAMQAAFNHLGQLLSLYDGPLLLRGSSALHAEQIAANSTPNVISIFTSREIVPTALRVQWPTMVGMRQLRMEDSDAAADIDALAGGSDFDFRLLNPSGFDHLVGRVLPHFQGAFQTFITDQLGGTVLLKPFGDANGRAEEKPLELDVAFVQRPNGVSIAKIGIRANMSEDTTFGGGLNLFSVDLVRTPSDPRVNDRRSLNQDFEGFPVVIASDGSMSVDVPYYHKPMYNESVVLQPGWNLREPARALEIATRALWKANLTTLSLLVEGDDIRAIPGATLTDMHDYFTVGSVKHELATREIDDKTQRMIRKNLLTAILLSPLKTLESLGQTGIWGIMQAHHADLPDWRTVRKALDGSQAGYRDRILYPAQFMGIPPINGWKIFYDACFPDDPDKDTNFLTGICNLMKIGL